MAHPPPKAVTRIHSAAMGPSIPPTPSPARRALMDVSDAVEFLKDTQQAYEALEMLVTPYGCHDSEKLELKRSQLGCLLRVINKAMRDQLGSAMQMVQLAKETR